ncbi:MULTISPECIES: DUF952 domain-containing protein [Parafrankia]|uniref:Glutathione S-transferase n=1 Tax=Parafrankia soli TaxID=2599596 RepID=A0A1S1RL69_9ACTN|nr:MULTISPECIES: DUF952 domain-containing protein [Parafrankia]OHV46836.1 hypothetical protein BBK14_00755 [Parafrankia soli]TCJ36920.1 DUF952 domain-containing protein [Parafrankia sp. BMG5.11]CAI7973699.1 conserved hypothetical protein [Frankia sp. Hr75.2]SQD94346.1 conserved hypothetical protein [Parafrankia sp. Ea1.12]
MICHLVGRDAWAVGPANYHPPSLDAEGFIHFSAPEQVLETASRYYSGRSDLLLLVVDPERLTAPLRWEPASGEDDRGGALFPHLYGMIDPEAVRAVVPLPPTAEGTFAVMPGLW